MDPMQVVSITAIPAWVPSVRVRNIGGTLLISVDGESFELSETAGCIWRLIDGIRTVREIGIQLAREYDVEPDLVISDVVDTIGDFLRRCAVIA